MKKTDGTIKILDGDVEDENALFTYSEHERQNNRINREVAKLVFTPHFIPFYPKIKDDYGLSDTETLLFGFISFYMSNSEGRFYFTNEQLASMFNVSTVTISNSIKNLKKYNLIKASYKIKTGGGTIRFISDVKKFNVSHKASFKPHVKKFNGNNNKIKDNKINTNVPFVERYVSSFNEKFGTRYRVTAGRKKKLRARLKVFSFDLVLEALNNLSKSKFHSGDNDRGWCADPDFLIRSDEQVDRWLNATTASKRNKIKFINSND